MRKLLLLVLISISASSTLYPNILKEVDFSQNERRAILELSVENLDVDVVKYNTLDDPPRLYVDIENISKRPISNFVRSFDNENMLVTGLRLWYHDSLGKKRNVYRLVFDYNEDMLNEYKVVRDEKDKIYVLLYPKSDVSLVPFNWDSKSLPEVVKKEVVAVSKSKKTKENKVKERDSETTNLVDSAKEVKSETPSDIEEDIVTDYTISDISVKGFGFAEDIVVKFKESLPKFRVDKVSDEVFLIEFDKAIHLDNEGMQRFFEKDFGVFKKVEFFEKDIERDEKSVVKISTSKPVSKTSGIAVRESDNTIIVSALSKSNNVFYSYSLNSEVYLPFKSEEKIASASSFFENLLTEIVTPVFAQEISDSSRYIKVQNQRVNIRSGPGNDYDVVGGLTAGDVVETFGGRLGYYRIRHNDSDAWVRANLVVALKSGSPPPMEIVSQDADETEKKFTEDESFEEFPSKPKYKVNANRLNLRSENNSKAPLVKSLNRDDILIAQGHKDNWFKVVLESDASVEGWVSSDFVVPYQESVQQFDSQQQEIASQQDEASQVQPQEPIEKSVFDEREKVVFTRSQPIDPFIPRIKSTSVESGPNVEDLTLVGIIYDEYDKIALLESKDRALDKTIFTMREGDRVRNGRLYKIYEDRIVFLITIFGVTKTHILRIETNR